MIEQAEAVADDGHADEDLEEDVKAHATPATLTAATAETRGAAAGAGKRGRGDDQHEGEDRQGDQQRALARRCPITSARGPVPASCWGTCWSA